MALNTKTVGAVLNTQMLNMIYHVNRIYQNKFSEDLKKQFVNTYKFGNHDINKFVLILRKSVYPYKYMSHGKNSAKHYLKKKLQ